MAKTRGAGSGRQIVVNSYQVNSAHSDLDRCNPYARTDSRARRPGRHGTTLRRLTSSLLLAMALSLLFVSMRAWVPAPSSAASGWNWYKTDTHFHSVVSGDALADVGIISQAGQARGYDAIFLTDHQHASEFPISTWKANRVTFDEGYDRWLSGTS